MCAGAGDAGVLETGEANPGWWRDMGPDPCVWRHDLASSAGYHPIRELALEMVEVLEPVEGNGAHGLRQGCVGLYSGQALGQRQGHESDCCLRLGRKLGIT